MPIEVQCPKCGGFLLLEDHLAGKQIECTECGGRMTVPEPQPAAHEKGKSTESETTFEERMASEAEMLRRQAQVPQAARRTGVLLVVIAVIAAAILAWHVPWLIERLKVQADISLLEGDSRPERRAAAKHLATAANRTAVGPLIKFLKDDDTMVRCYCAEALGKVGDKRASAALIEALADEADSVRCEAAWALATCGAEDARPALQALLNSSETPGQMEANARFALCMLGDSQQFDALIGMLYHPNIQARANAARALGAIGRTDAISYLQKAMVGNPVIVKKEISDALKKLGASRD